MTHMKFMLEDCAIAQAVGLWPLMAEVWVRSQVSPCGICGGQYGTRSSFSPSTSVFLSVSLYRRSILIFANVFLLPERQTGKAWEP